MGTILNPLYTAVSWVIVQFHRLFSPVFGADTGWAWGLSIVCLVVLIRICLIPLFVKQIKATRNMQALQPKIKEIQKRYKDDRERQSQEMMKLYKETGTNPFSSCLPILVQSPFFFALFHVLSKVSSGKTVGEINEGLVHSAQKAHIFGAPLAAKFTDSADKVAHLGSTMTDVRVVTAIMIVLMSASQFITQRQLMLKNTDPAAMAGNPFAQQQKILMYVFPVMFAVFGINFPVGVLVYWLTTNVWTMGQQLFVISRNPTPGSVAYQARQKRLAERAERHGKVLTAEGDVITKEEHEQREEERKAQAAKRVQPARTSKAKRKTGPKGSTVRTPPTARGGADTLGHSSASTQKTEEAEQEDTVESGAPSPSANGKSAPEAASANGSRRASRGASDTGGPRGSAQTPAAAGSSRSGKGPRQQPRKQSQTRKNQGRKKS